MNRREALADSIAKYGLYSDLDGPAYQQRNPGALREVVIKIKDGLRVPVPTHLRSFKSLVDGYEALRHDLLKKCNGTSRIGMKETAPLKELLFVYGFGEETIPSILKYLRRVLKDSTLDENVPVGFFLKGE